jgi:hypothetical protein
MFLLPTVATVSDRRFPVSNKCCLCEAGKPAVRDRRYSGEPETAADVSDGSPFAGLEILVKNRFKFFGDSAVLDADVAFFIQREIAG